MSLKTLADLAGTSPAAIHRYEGGWGRFELRTLQRLAMVLGARLVVSIEPADRPAPPERLDPTRIVSKLKGLFWDVDLTADHLGQNPDWVLRRALQFGDWEQIHDARLFFGDDAVRRAAQHRSVDARTRGFWQVVLGPEEARR